MKGYFFNNGKHRKRVPGVNSVPCTKCGKPIRKCTKRREHKVCPKQHGLT